MNVLLGNHTIPQVLEPQGVNPLSPTKLQEGCLSVLSPTSNPGSILGGGLPFPPPFFFFFVPVKC